MSVCVYACLRSQTLRGIRWLTNYSITSHSNGASQLKAKLRRIRIFRAVVGNYYHAHAYASHIHTHLHPHTFSGISTCIEHSADWHTSPPPVSSDLFRLFKLGLFSFIYAKKKKTELPWLTLLTPPSLSFFLLHAVFLPTCWSLSLILLCVFIFLHPLPSAQFTTHLLIFTPSHSL